MKSCTIAWLVNLLAVYNSCNIKYYPTLKRYQINNYIRLPEFYRWAQQLFFGDSVRMYTARLICCLATGLIIFVVDATKGQNVNCNMPLSNDASLSKFVTNGVLRASVISTTPLVHMMTCTASCIATSSCCYIGLNTVAMTCTLLAAKSGPPITYTSFTEVYALKSRTARVIN